ncbi:glycosyltransferase [Candidatus Pelagibacter sp. Uisw_113]|uniref:glycosyltransferase n=1 Tax=Candidatus Pelagibacter sp. Uisw_113 TaxID=3230994 RepID=UPI0039ED2315
MSISRQNLSIVIVTFKSEGVIHECIKSIDKDIKITVVENSNNYQFKDELEKSYKNVSCVLSNENLGMGSGNNIGIKKAETDFVLILNPDVILEPSTINELIIASEKISNFAIIAPISSDINYPNYKFKNNKKISIDYNFPFKVKSIDGFAMLFNKKKLDIIFHKNYFDENFFMYLENDDLCKRIIEAKEDIFIVPISKIKHLGGKAVNVKYKNEVEFARNWHWIWSKFYFNKKHHGYFAAFIKGFPKFIFSFVKYIFYLLIKDKVKQRIYLNRASGFINAAINKKSWYRSQF